MRLTGVLLGLALAVGCTDGDGPTTVRLRVVTAPGLALDGLAVVIDADRREAAMAERLEVRVPAAWAGTAHPLAVDGLVAGRPVATGTADVTPIAGATVDATVTLVSTACPALCTIDAPRCDGDGVAVCELGDDGCPSWSVAAACPSATPYCSNGACATTCVDECAAGQTACAGPAAERGCGEADSDACLDWGPAEACDEGEVCDGAACADAAVLTVATVGPGSVTSSPSGIACGATCAARYALGTAVTLTAAPIGEAGFLGWSGGGCTGDDDACVVELDADADVTVTARFEGACASSCEPEAVAAGLISPGPIGLDDGHVYWSDLGSPAHRAGVYRRPRAGGEPVELADGLGTSELAIDPGHVYLTGAFGGAFRFPLAGGAPHRYGAFTDNGYGLALDATTVYWSDPDAGTIKRRPRSGGAVESFVAQAAGCDVLALDGVHLYWTDPPDATIFRRALAGGAIESFATGVAGSSTPWRLAIDAGHVYWSTRDGNAILRRAKAGGVVETFAAGQDGAHGVALDASHVYWSADLLGAVRRRSKAGGPIETLAAGLAGPQRLAVDADHVYWGDGGLGSGRAGRIARRPLTCGCDP